MNHWIDSIDSLNHNLGNLNYFQRNLSREVTKINQFKHKAKLEGKDPNDWRKQYRLPNAPSKMENLVISSLIQNYCVDLENTVALEQAKVAGVEKALEL
ncbi:unnamed protein product [Ambrosiozyma monospora]|uniref:Unnamed protein product n=1 Tax=Ambrosiozyma monospora TaxID=43982 RepID=A0ACB5TDG4_AMBMO|nr:unnamed protein product [Ambrosiozyma monospora]